MPDARQTWKEAWKAARVDLNAAEHKAEEVITKIAGMAGLKHEDVHRYMARLTDRLMAMKEAIEGAVKSAADHFKLASREEVGALRQRVDEITDRVDELMKAGEDEEVEKIGASG